LQSGDFTPTLIERRAARGVGGNCDIHVNTHTSYPLPKLPGGNENKHNAVGQKKDAGACYSYIPRSGLRIAHL
jgi:hypothetical protein